MSDDIDIDIDDLSRRMDGAMTALRHDFSSLRTGRASAALVEPIQVDAYGQMTPVNQLGTVNVPEPRMVTINIWDKGMVGKVEKAIRESGIGINPQTNGDGMDQIKKAKTAGMPEDDQKMWHDEVQELTDKAIAAVDKALQAKQAEIMQV